MERINYHHLRYFWAIAHAGSLTRAASRLHLSQSAVSVQLGKLEQQLGHRLFERTGKRLILTEAGRIALDYADTIFESGEELVATLSGRPVANRRVLRVGAITTLSRNFQLEFLRPILARADVALSARSGSMGELLALIEAHALDVVLANSAPRPDPRTDLRSYLLKRQPVSLVGRRRKPARRFRFPEDLRTVPIILPSKESEIRLAFDRILDEAEVVPVIQAEVDDMALLRVLARESSGVTLVPSIVVRDELADGVLVEHCAIADLTESFYAIVQRRRFPNPVVAELLTQYVGKRKA